MAKQTTKPQTKANETPAPPVVTPPVDEASAPPVDETPEVVGDAQDWDALVKQRAADRAATLEQERQAAVEAAQLEEAKAATDE